MFRSTQSVLVHGLRHPEFRNMKYSVFSVEGLSCAWELSMLCAYGLDLQPFRKLFNHYAQVPGLFILSFGLFTTLVTFYMVEPRPNRGLDT